MKKLLSCLFVFSLLTSCAHYSQCKKCCKKSSCEKEEKCDKRGKKSHS